MLEPTLRSTPDGLEVTHPTEAEQRADREKQRARFRSLVFIGSKAEADALQHFVLTRAVDVSFIIEDATDEVGRRIPGNVRMRVVEAPR